MMIDYNIRDDWPEHEPRWLKRLVSSLSRQTHETSILALTVAVAEIVDWVELASGKDAWARKENRASLREDLAESFGALGIEFRAYLQEAFDTFTDAFDSLSKSGSPVLQQSPGVRTGALWLSVAESGRQLAARSATDDAVRACWNDLVDISRRSDSVHREHRPVVNMLLEQQRARHRDPERITRDVTTTLAFGPEQADAPWIREPTSVAERLALAEQTLLAPASLANIAVWFSYSHLRLERNFEAGGVAFFLPYYLADGTTSDLDYRFKDELIELNRTGWWKQVSTDPGHVSAIVRVELGDTYRTDSFERATRILDTLLDIVVHQGNGQRPEQGHSVAVFDGQPTSWRGKFNKTVLTADDDSYGVEITSKVFRAVTPRLGEAISASNLPRFLAAALEAQSAADEPRARGKMPTRLEDSDVREMIAAEDRVAQHIAALSAQPPGPFLAELTRMWCRSTWHRDLDHALRYCLVTTGGSAHEIETLRGHYYSRSWWGLVSFAAEHEAILLSYCHVDAEREWIARMLRSVSDPQVLKSLMSEYSIAAEVLGRRRTRARNAVVHGNPLASQAATSVLDLSEYVGSHALQLGIDSYKEGMSVQSAMSEEQAQWLAAMSAPSLAEYARVRDSPHGTESD